MVAKTVEEKFEEEIKAIDWKQFVVSKKTKKVELIVGDGMIVIEIRDVPWSLRNQLMTNSMGWDENGKTFWDTNTYNKECLKYMITKAPWGATSEAFLLSIDGELGAALEALVPKRMEAKARSVDKIKKESSSG
jgi:hypothetical protein